MSPQELIVYVNADGTPTGETAPKLAAHTANTKLHLAFSCYVFDAQGHFLVTQRAHGKKVWPGVFTNSLCGHPGPVEPIETAIQRRAHYELGMQLTDIQVVLPAYTYKSPLYNGIVEHEFCPVFVARASDQPHPNAQEVADYSWMPWLSFVTSAEADVADVWSWWCKDQLKQLKGQPLIERYSQPYSSSN